MSFFDNLSHFHFLRPLWLFGLLLLPLIYVAMRKRALSNSDWAKAIDPTLLKHLLPSNAQQQKQSRHFGMTLVLGFCFIALSGPAWQEKPQEVIKLTDNMVVILDLSLSMLASDTAPDRLTRSKQKLQDLLKLRKEGTTALIAFSGDSHIVTPLTDDTNTIIANLPALDPYIMPVIGSRPDLAINQALKLLKQGKANNGRIVLLTDGVTSTQAERINDMLQGSNTSLLILAAGTAAGGPIKLPQKGYLKDDGNVVIPKTDFASLSSLAQQNSGKMLRMTLDDQDLNRLDIDGSLTRKNQEEQQNTPLVEKGFDAWEDMGFLLIFLIIPLVLRAHRQGVLVQLALMTTLCFMPVEESYAFGWDDLWQTKDQQAQRLLDQGKSSEAAERFKSSEHKANAHYQAKEFEQASGEYAQSDTANGFYNQGNALAQQQKFKEAIEAYDEALKVDPANEDAQHNKSLIEEFLKKQSESSDQQDSDSQDSDSQDPNQDDSEQKDSENKDSQNKDSDQNNTDDKQSQQDQSEQDKKQGDKSGQSDQENQENQEQDEKSESDKDKQEKQQSQKQNQQAQQQESEPSALPEPDELSEEEKQSYEQWMRRVPDDPGGLLRRKFEQQSRERNRNSREAGEPIW